MAEIKMPEINYVMIAGNLTKDPVYRVTNHRTPVVNFTLASNRKYRDSENQWQEDVCFIGVVAWNKLAESCRDGLHKGSAVLVDGELQSRTWKNENGVTKSIIEIKARRIQFINKRAKCSGDEDCHAVFYDDEVLSYEPHPAEKYSIDENDLLHRDAGTAAGGGNGSDNCK